MDAVVELVLEFILINMLQPLTFYSGMQVGNSVEFNTYDYVHPEFKEVIATGEYAAHYWFEQGWKACRLAFLLHQQAEDAGAFRV